MAETEFPSKGASCKTTATDVDIRSTPEYLRVCPVSGAAAWMSTSTAFIAGGFAEGSKGNGLGVGGVAATFRARAISGLALEARLR